MRLSDIANVVDYPVWINDTRFELSNLYGNAADLFAVENPAARVKYITVDSDGYITIEI